MKYFYRLLAMLLLSSLVGCGHSINITPPMNTLDKEVEEKIDKNVGYYISNEDLNKEVTTPGGGGDKVKYFPYKETEPAFNKILSNIFIKVVKLQAADDVQEIAANDISYIFTPVFSTDSSSESMFTWPPTKFSMKIACKAIDKSGEVIWEKTVESEGSAEFDQFKHDFSLAARKATQKAFNKLQDEILTSGKF
ncbi:hypothetical protein [Desulfosediminicola flagellatus]|uniref:hypothetical protein n=1 Tax=Desulfosediminicola flagellatus TaxID=2569541 RepID=UPI0010AD1421|nr:hypothetical protein [Desulfosediminicola flagellatus]